MNYLSRCSVFLGWCTILIFWVAPLSGLPEVAGGGLQPGDVCWLLAMYFWAVALVRKPKFPRVSNQLLLITFSVYVGSVLLFPMFGVILLEGANLSWLLGDIRWLQAIAVGALFVWFYSRRPYSLYLRDVCYLFVLILSVNWVVLLAQIHMQIHGGNAPLVLEWRYPNGEGAYGQYGFHIGRYAGSMTYASGLSAFGSISLLFTALSRNRSWYMVTIGLSGLIFVLASGSRTAIFSLIFIVPSVLLVSAVLREDLHRISLPRIGLMALTLAGIAWAAMKFNLGRLTSSNRIQQTISWIMGEASFEEISGRGGERWLEPINQSLEWTPIGTLVNPAHALSELPTFDSYYIFLLAQAGPFILLCYLALVCIFSIHASQIWLQNRDAGALPLSISMMLVVMGITQNLMTGLIGRFFLVLGVSSILIYYTQHSKPLRRPHN